MDDITQIETALLRRISATLLAMGTPGCRELARELDEAIREAHPSALQA